MISRIEALNSRCLRYIRQPLSPFHVLVGPNASGKTTFLDVVSFLGILVSDGLEAALATRTKNFVDLLWNRSGSRFELAIEATLPPEISTQFDSKDYSSIRYEIAIGTNQDSETEDVCILAERVFLKPSKLETETTRYVFPEAQNPPETILHANRRGWHLIVSKHPEGNVNFAPEVRLKSGRSWSPTFKLGSRKSALGNLPAYEAQFPACTWLKSLLSEGVQPFVLDSLHLRQPSPPNQRNGFRTDGSNLPHVVAYYVMRPENWTNDRWLLSN